MREKIILASGLNASELFQSMAMHEIDCINTKVMTSVELAKFALIRSGVFITENILDSREELIWIAKAVEGDSYFENPSLSDLQDITNAIYEIRLLVTTENEAEEIKTALDKGIFKEKNKSLISIYQKYVNLLKENNLIDRIGIILKALKEASTLNCEFIYLDEYPLYPLEKQLLNKISGKSATAKSISTLYDVNVHDIKIEKFSKCYGAPNEVEYILDTAYSNYQLDECTVAVTDTGTYSQLFYDCAVLYDIPVTFGCGIPVTNSYPARLLKKYHRWMTDGYFGSSALLDMLKDRSFDSRKLQQELQLDDYKKYNEFLEKIATVRLTNDRTINESRVNCYEAVPDVNKDYIEPLRMLAQELSLPTESFIEKYAVIRRGSSDTSNMIMKLDNSARSYIINNLRVIKSANTKQLEADMIISVLSGNVCTMRPEKGKIHITGVNKAFSAIRKNMFVAGMSANIFPGASKENYLLLDNDLECFVADTSNLTSEGKVLKKRNEIFTLLGIATALNNKIYLSYAYINVAELKKVNASSVFFEIMIKLNPDIPNTEEADNRTQKIDYFTPRLSLTRNIGHSFNLGDEIKIKATQNEKASKEIVWDLDREYYSPSALEIFFECRKRFLLRYLLHLKVAEEKKIFEVIPANDKGKIAHELMVALANSNMDKETFLKLSSEKFDNYILQNNPVVFEQIAKEKEQFIEMMEIAYDMDEHREVILHEEKQERRHESGVNLKGYPDRVEKLPDESVIVVDYKTGRTIKHEKDDIDTCLQIVIYAYSMEQLGHKVDHCEYRYIRLGETITCKYDDDMKKKLFDKLSDFKTALINNDFEIPVPLDEKTVCKYCDYGSICGKGAVGEVTNND